jgi:hypothetical protein
MAACLSPPSCCLQVVKASTNKKQRKAPLAGFEIGFTPENEVFISRMAMLGFGSAVVGEALTGGGVLAQLGYQLGLQQVRICVQCMLLLLGSLVQVLHWLPAVNNVAWCPLDLWLPATRRPQPHAIMSQSGTRYRFTLACFRIVWLPTLVQCPQWLVHTHMVLLCAFQLTNPHPYCACAP